MDIVMLDKVDINKVTSTIKGVWLITPQGTLVTILSDNVLVQWMDPLEWIGNGMLTDW